MKRLLDLVAQDLKLDPKVSRNFLVSVSGGADSSLLLVAMAELARIFPIRLSAVHFNFHLRGADSERDENYVRRLARKYEVELHIENSPLKKNSSVQEMARGARLKYLKALPTEIEIVEAHHADDQLETFFFRLIRGASLKGLSGMKSPTNRVDHKIWRPFLGIWKAEIIAHCRKLRLRPRLDRSNLRADYDRNFLRLKILRPLFQRFPSSRLSLLKSVEDFRDRSEAIEREVEISSGQVVLSDSPLSLSRTELLKLAPSQQRDFLNRLFMARLKINLSRHKTCELQSLLAAKQDFTFNAPRDHLVRCRSDRLWVERAPQNRKVTKAETALY